LLLGRTDIEFFQVFPLDGTEAREGMEGGKGGRKRREEGGKR